MLVARVLAFSTSIKLFSQLHHICIYLASTLIKVRIVTMQIPIISMQLLKLLHVHVMIGMHEMLLLHWRNSIRNRSIANRLICIKLKISSRHGNTYIRFKTPSHNSEWVSEI